MQNAGLKICETPTADGANEEVMSTVLARLFFTASQNVHEIVAPLSETDRARLAVYCYSRAHLNAIGLAIAATCSVDHLMAASHSSAAGRALFAQSRESPPSQRTHSGRRAITLPSSAGAPPRWQAFAGMPA